MNRVWSSFKSHPYITNVVGYTTLFSTADIIQQCFLERKQQLNNRTTLERDLEEQRNSTHIKISVIPEVTLDISKKGVESQGYKKGKIHNNDITEVELGYQHTEPSSKMTKGFGINWSQTARVAIVGFCFHANFNYHWLKILERMWPGGEAKKVAGKVLLDQLIAAPATISVFYIGLSALERKKDLLEDWQNKFWTSYKTGVVYWSTMQAVNFSLVPPVARTVFVGGITLVWTVFLCNLRQQRGGLCTDGKTK